MDYTFLQPRHLEKEFRGGSMHLHTSVLGNSLILRGLELLEAVEPVDMTAAKKDVVEEMELPGDKTEIPQEQAATEGPPMDEAGKDKMPVDAGAQEGLPMDEAAENELPMDGGAQEELPMEEAAEDELPADKGAQQDLPMDEEALEVLPEEVVALKRLPVDEVASSPAAKLRRPKG
jgi:hypothetical protein